MVDVRAADGDETQVWSRSRSERLRSWYGRFGRSTAWVDHAVGRRTHVRDDSAVHTFVVADGATDIGFVTVEIVPYGPNAVAALTDLWIRPDHRRRGIGTSVRGWAEEWASKRAKSLFVTVDPADPAVIALFAAYPVRAQTMMKRLETPAALPAGVVGRPMTEDEYGPWLEESIRGYADDIANSGSMPYEDAIIRSRTQFDELLPLGLRTPENTFWTIYAGPDAVATNWLRHRSGPETSFVFGVEAHEEFRGRGYGRAAMSVGEQAAIDAGDSHLSLNVFGHNDVAINLYTGMGYEVVDQNRSIDF